MGGMIACELASEFHFAGIALLGPVHPVPGLADVFAARIKRVQESKHAVPNAVFNIRANKIERRYGVYGR